MGGKDADIKDYPYAISLRKAEKNGKFKHNCGGSLVRKYYSQFLMNMSIYKVFTNLKGSMRKFT